MTHSSLLDTLSIKHYCVRGGLPVLFQYWILLGHVKYQVKAGAVKRCAENIKMGLL